MKTDNELIAEFMDYNVRYWGPVLYRADEDGFVDFTGDPQTFHPNLCWSDLIPVIQKIDNMWDTIADQDDVRDGEAYSKVIMLSITVPIETAYKEVVEFIKWYNTQPKETTSQQQSQPE